jgi:hypothetical protein
MPESADWTAQVVLLCPFYEGHVTTAATALSLRILEFANASLNLTTGHILAQTAKCGLPHNSGKLSRHKIY